MFIRNKRTNQRWRFLLGETMNLKGKVYARKAGQYKKTYYLINITGLTKENKKILARYHKKKVKLKIISIIDERERKVK